MSSIVEGDGRRALASEPNVGGDMKIVLQDRLVVDAAANPDFAQIESDEPQTTVNKRFEVYFPEKRPFFTENAGYFDAPMADGNRLLFTRRIADPAFGIRLTGKVDGFAVGALFADDRAGDANFHSVRVSRDLPRQSNIGAMFVEKRGAGAVNQVFDLDTTWRLGQTWAATLLAAASRTSDPIAGSTSGTDVEARVNRQGRGFNYNLQFVSMAPHFDARSGFVSRTDNRYLTEDGSYTFWPDSWITKLKMRMYLEKAWFFDGSDSYATAAPTASFEIAHQTTLEVYSVQWHDVLRPLDFAALEKTRSFDEASYGVFASSAQLRRLRFDARWEAGHRLHYVPPARQAPFVARFQRSQLTLSVRPTGSMTIDNTYLFDRNISGDGTAMFTSHIARTNVNWQWNREASLRFIGQYDAVLANPLFASTPTSRRFNTDVLFTYLVHPGTAIYVGYNSDHARPWPAPSVPVDRFVNDSRQLFVKASYLIRP
jgi:hypothetical protein